MKFLSHGKTSNNTYSPGTAMSPETTALSFHDVRPTHIIYMLSTFLGFIILDVFNIWDAKLFIDSSLSSLDSGSLFFLFFCIGEGGSIFIINSKRLKQLSVFGALVGGAAIGLEFTGPAGIFHAVNISAAGFGLGIFGACVFYVFIFILNNTEKLLTCSIITLVTMIFPVIYRLSITNNHFIISRILSAVIILIIITCVLRYKNTDSPDTSGTGHFKVMPGGAYWLLYFIVVFFIVEALGRAIVTRTNMLDGRMMAFNYFGAVIGVAVILIMRILFSKNAWFMWNIYFFICAVGFLFNLFSLSGFENGPVIGSLFLGAGSSSGYIAIWYLAGVISKRYLNMRFVRVGMAVTVLAAALGNGLQVLIAAYGENTLSIVGSIASLLFILLFMVLSPVFYGFFCLGEWMADIHGTGEHEDGEGDTMEGQENNTRSAKAGNAKPAVTTMKPRALIKTRLTPREQELFDFYVDGYTLKQISAMMNISYNTVLTHYKSVYSKLEVNNKTELIRKYLEA